MGGGQGGRDGRLLELFQVSHPSVVTRRLLRDLLDKVFTVSFLFALDNRVENSE